MFIRYIIILIIDDEGGLKEKRKEKLDLEMVSNV